MRRWWFAGSVVVLTVVSCAERSTIESGLDTGLTSDSGATTTGPAELVERYCEDHPEIEPDPDDHEPPVVEFLAPPDGLMIGYAGDFRIFATAVDHSCIKHAMLTVDGARVDKTDSGPLEWQANSAPPGSYEIGLTVEDLQGNAATVGVTVWASDR